VTPDLEVRVDLAVICLGASGVGLLVPADRREVYGARKAVESLLVTARIA
jgi:hypothetical protein